MTALGQHEIFSKIYAISICGGKRKFQKDRGSKGLKFLKKKEAGTIASFS